MRDLVGHVVCGKNSSPGDFLVDPGVQGAEGNVGQQGRQDTSLADSLVRGGGDHGQVGANEVQDAFVGHDDLELMQHQLVRNLLEAVPYVLMQDENNRLPGVVSEKWVGVG
jgi:hypothetical protein